TAAEGRVSWKAVALPVEHGGGGGLPGAVPVGPCSPPPARAARARARGPCPAPGAAGCGVALAALAAFLARQPLKIVLADRRRGARHPRTAVGESFVLGYGLLALLGLLA